MNQREYNDIKRIVLYQHVFALLKLSMRCAQLYFTPVNNQILIKKKPVETLRGIKWYFTQKCINLRIF